MFWKYLSIPENKSVLEAVHDFFRLFLFDVLVMTAKAEYH